MGQIDLAIGVPSGSPVVTFKLECPCCDSPLTLEVDISRSKHKLVEDFKSSYGDLMAVVEGYKRVRGYDKIPTWNSMYMRRNMSTAKKLLRFFRKTAAPVEIAIECIEDANERARREGWGDNFTLETVVKRAPDWILDKQKRRG